jgi:hypothetical protein
MERIVTSQLSAAHRGEAKKTLIHAAAQCPGAATHAPNNILTQNSDARGFSNCESQRGDRVGGHLQMRHGATGAESKRTHCGKRTAYQHPAMM